MEYTLSVRKVMGSVISVAAVADVMARAVATNNGTLPFHGPTYTNSLRDYESDLLKAAHSGRLVVCDARGAITSADEIIEVAKKSGELRFAIEVAKTQRELFDTTEVAKKSSELLAVNEDIDVDKAHLQILFTTAQFLNDWRRHMGDTFTVIDLPVEMVEWGPTDANGKGYYRGFVGASTDATGITPASNERIKPVARSTAQAAAILEEIQKLRLDPLALPKAPAGKSGVKAEIRKLCLVSRKDVFQSKRIFDDA